MDINLIKIMALELDFPTLLNLCSSSKRLNKEICNNQLFWKNKLHQDYPMTIKIQTGDFKKIYESLLKNKMVDYFIMISSINPVGVPPKIWDYTIKREEYFKNNNYDNYSSEAEELPDFTDRGGEEAGFNIVGDFPKGTKAWLVYSENNELINQAFLSKEEAREYIIDYTRHILRLFYEQREDLEEYYGATLEQMIGYHTAQEALEAFEKIIEIKGYFSMPGFADEGDESIYYMIQEITL